MNRIRPKQSRGFTLVEVAVVLFFMGIFVSFAASMMKNIALSTKLRDARDKLTVVSDAVQSWANPKRRLPTNLSGHEDSFETVLSQPRDYWNKKYSFYPYTTSQSVAFRDVCRIKSTTLAVCESGDCINKVKKDIAYVLVSGGDNLEPTVPPLADVSTVACTGLKCIPLYEQNVTKTPPYDDIYKYVTLLELKRTAGCVEADSGLRILNVDLPLAHENTFYSPVVIQADGGLLFAGANRYKWCVLSGTLPAGMLYNPPIVLCSDPTPTQVTSFSISGTPTGIPAGTSTSTPITLTVKDANNFKVDKTVFLNVANP